MAAKLNWILQKPAYQLALKAALFAGLLYFYYGQPGVFRAGLFLAAALLLYSRPLAGSFNYLPLFLVILILAFWSGPAGGWLLALAFGLLLGLKVLALTHRQFWLYLLTIILGYLTFLDFFLTEKSAGFVFYWLASGLVVFLLLQNLFQDRLTSAVAALLLSQLLWLLSWLPVGFLTAANLLLLVLLLLLETCYYQRLSPRSAGLFVLLTLIVLTTGYWRL